MTAGDSGGAVPKLSAEQLVAAVPGLADTRVRIDVLDFRRVPGASLTFGDIAALHDAIDKELPTADGIVVTQGTDTIEETAYLLDLLYGGPQPIVVTGAMRNPSLASADGPGNLLAAIHVAASPLARNQGCLVVLADEIHAARRVRKTHTTSGTTFRSTTGGPLGYVVEGHPRFLNRLGHRVVIPARPSDDVRVALVTIGLGDDGTVIEAIADRVDGLVVAAMGAGHVPARIVGQLEQLAGRMPVVLASRTGSGSVLAETYGFDGSERDLLNRGLISAGFVDSIKARILLHTLISGRATQAQLASAFAVAGGYADADLWPWPPKPIGREDAGE